MTQIELIHWALIRESQQNPRKSFNEDSLKELAESINKQGLLQPITVRPIPEFKVLAPKELKGKSGYEIVCGARRYRAAKMTDLVEIPCIVREMTDEEAFDAMITENLQRKDVEPMDEARAFNELHKRGTSFEELAARFGKSVSFIRLRIKLNDLVPDLAELLEKKELQISHAQELCKISIQHQTELFESKYSDKVESYYKWNDKAIKDIKRLIENDFRKLDKAIFNNSLCLGCESRCGTNALFSEYDEDKCSNPVCYDDKTFNFRLETAIQKATEGYVLVKRSESYNKDIVVEELEKRGFTLIDNDYKTIGWENTAETPELPEREEDDSDEDWAETLEAYEADLKEYEVDLARDEERIQNGHKRAWFIGYWSEDEYKLIKFKDENIQSPEQLSQNNKLAELKSKDKRNAEIKNEKVTEELKKLMLESNYETWSYPTTELERALVIAAMISKCEYKFTRNIENSFDKNITYIENCKPFIGSPTEAQIIRAFIKNHVTGYSTSGNVQLRAISKEVFNDDTLKIELKHEDTYLKRKENIDKQIKELSDANTEER